MLRERSHLVLKDGVLCRQRTVEDSEKLQLVLPNLLKPHMLEGFHNVLGHLGRDKTLEIIAINSVGLVWRKMWTGT